MKYINVVVSQSVTDHSVSIRIREAIDNENTDYTGHSGKEDCAFC